MVPGVNAVIAVHHVQAVGKRVHDALDKCPLVGDLPHARRELALKVRQLRIAGECDGKDVGDGGQQLMVDWPEWCLPMHDERGQYADGGSDRKLASRDRKRGADAGRVAPHDRRLGRVRVRDRHSGRLDGHSEAVEDRRYTVRDVGGTGQEPEHLKERRYRHGIHSGENRKRSHG